jgi:hypothetical protein
LDKRIVGTFRRAAMMDHKLLIANDRSARLVEQQRARARWAAQRRSHAQTCYFFRAYLVDAPKGAFVSLTVLSRVK